jgi:hypothetical protein
MTTLEDLEEARKQLARLYNAYFAGAKIFGDVLDAETEVARLREQVKPRILYVNSGDNCA